MPVDLGRQIRNFAKLVADSKVEVYNEPSVQFQLASFVQSQLGTDSKVNVERNIEYFGLTKADFLKKEMDIVVFSPDLSEKHCIELKFPRQGQYPEQMFSACKDVKFLEQLTEVGFGTSYFVMFAEDHLFYDDKGGAEIYKMFRTNKTIRGMITKPTGSRDESFQMEAEYNIEWQLLKGWLRYFVLEVERRTRAAK